MICKIKKRKLLSACLTITMIITLLPVTAFAAEAPTLLSATVTSNGGVGLTFSKEMSATDLANKITEGFTITGLEETPKTITNATLHSASGGTNNFVQLYLSPTIKGGEAASLSYTPGDVRAEDGGLLAGIAAMDIENNAPHPDLLTTPPPAATLGSAYTHTLTASGGTGPYTFSVDGGNLPSGLTMSSTGVISGTPTVAASFTFFIMVKDSNEALDIEGFSITVSPSTEKVCEINGTQYETLDAALTTIPANGSATIKLLRNLNYQAGIYITGKTIIFDLNGFTLDINNPAEGGVGLDVVTGGNVTLTGSGALNVTGKAYGVRVSTNGAATHATVTNATATGTEGEAAYAAGTNATLTVLGDATVTGISGYGAHTISKALIDIKGSVYATNQGVYASDSTIKVAGNVQANGNNMLEQPIGIGVGVYGGTGEVKIGGNVTANRVGAMVRAGGSVTIDGMLTAPAYIQFADNEPTAIENYITQTTKEGYRTYKHPNYGTVWMLGEMPTSTYALTVTNGTGGGNYAKDAVIAITANTAPSGQQFKEWSITPSVTFTDNTNKNSQAAKFIMPEQPVAATAVFEPVSATSYNVAVYGSYAGISGVGSYTQGSTITIHAGNRNGYTFTGWTSPDGVTFVHANNPTTTFTMPAKNVSVTANWNYSNGGGGGSTPSGGSGTTTPKYEASLSSDSSSVNVEAKVNKTNASAELSPAQVGKGKNISVSMPKIPDIKSFTLGIPIPSLSDASGNGSVTLNTNAGKITLPSNMLAGTNTASDSKAQISIGTVKAGDLPKDTQDKVGTHPIVSLSLSIDGKAVAWNNPNAPVTVSIPYSPTAEELKNPDRITVWYIDGSGNLVEMRDAKYDPAAGTVVFQTTHFSFYAVGYKVPVTSAKFTDVLPGAWYYDAVTFIAEKGITTGTGDGRFSPEAILTRGQFIVMLMKACGIEAEKNPTGNFSDAGNAYYTAYLATAYAKGISSGIGNNKFGPEQAITRQEMFTLLYNALKLLNKLPTGDNGKTIANFTDSGSVAGWATEALTALVKSGTASGSGNRLDPTTNTTRAQMAQVLYNLLGK